MPLRSLLNRLIERRLRRELADATAEADALLAKADASGKPITMSDEQHERLQRAAQAAGHHAVPAAVNPPACAPPASAFGESSSTMDMDEHAFDAVRMALWDLLVAVAASSSLGHTETMDAYLRGMGVLMEPEEDLHGPHPGPEDVRWTSVPSSAPKVPSKPDSNLSHGFSTPLPARRNPLRFETKADTNGILKGYSSKRIL